MILVHIYKYDGDSWDWRTYVSPRFSSEYGFQSWPSFETLSQISEPEDWSFHSDFMINRNHHPKGQTELVNQVKNQMKLPTDIESLQGFKSMLYLIQVNLKTSLLYFKRFFNDKILLTKLIYIVD